MILVVDMNWKANSLGFYEFVSPIVQIASEFEECVVKHFSEVTDLSSCRCIILSGTALKDNVTLKEPEKFEWLRHTDKPVLGICAGMQTIGSVFGLRVPPCLEIGITCVTTSKANPLFSGKFRVYSLHNYSVEPNGEFEIWAESKKCMQAMKHKVKPIYGILFHPEARNPELLRRFIQLKSG